MKKYSFGCYQLEIDMDATMKWYAQSKGWGCCHEPYPYGAPDFPEPHFDLEFYATLPWVLGEV